MLCAILRLNLDRLFRLQKLDVDSADHVCQREQHKRHRRRITKVKKPKRRAIDVETDRLGRESWSTFRQNKYLIKHTQQIHRAQEENDQDRRLQQRQRHVPERLTATRAVDQRCFVWFLWN